MISRILLKWSLGLAFGVLPLAGGCQQESSSPPPSPSTVAGATMTQPPVQPASPGDPAAAGDVSAAELADAPVTPITTNKPVPPYIRPGSPVSEIVKLANSGVDESVLLAFVNNSPNTFNLQADQIIYLNDLGVPANVVTAMLQHDQNFAAMQPNPALVSQPTAPAPDYGTAPAPVDAPLTPPEDNGNPDFYNSLSPYGNWVNVDGYGPCWQPTVEVANPDWQPYFDGGHWAYTDCGWYWMSDYSWGWAPFHYGRWFRHNRLGWCWAPDNVWGPSWVSWRYSNNYCGWAPLPPGVFFSAGFGLGFRGHHLRDGEDFGLGWDRFRFVPWDAFREHHLHGFAVGGRQAEQIYGHTTAVNRFVAGHNTIINQGISAARVAAATHQVIEPLKIRDTAMAPPRVGRAERIDSSTRTLSVYRPQVTAARAAVGANGFAGGPRWNAPVPQRGGLTQPYSAQTAPLILRGQEQLSPRPVPSAPAPGSSLVIIGRQQNGRPQPPAQAGGAPPSQIASTELNGTDFQTGRVQPIPRADSSRATPWLNARPAAPAAATAPGQYSAPGYSAPVRTAPNTPQYQPAPAYGVQRSYNAPTPSYRSQPAPSYSAPTRPSYSETPRSAPAPAYTGGSGGGARSAPSAPSAPTGHGVSDSGRR